jgi:hypothetical protein
MLKTCPACGYQFDASHYNHCPDCEEKGGHELWDSLREHITKQETAPTEPKAVLQKSELYKKMLKIAIKHLDDAQVLPEESEMPDEDWEQLDDAQRAYQWFRDLKAMARRELEDSNGKI